MGRLVHGSVLTVVGQDSMPISTAIRSLRQNSSSWFRRRATASNVPSSKKALFRLVMMPPKNRVGDDVTPTLVPALAEERMSMIPRALNSHPAKRAFLGLAEDDGAAQSVGGRRAADVVDNLGAVEGPRVEKDCRVCASSEGRSGRGVETTRNNMIANSSFLLTDNAAKARRADRSSART